MISVQMTMHIFWTGKMTLRNDLNPAFQNRMTLRLSTVLHTVITIMHCHIIQVVMLCHFPPPVHATVYLTSACFTESSSSIGRVSER